MFETYNKLFNLGGGAQSAPTDASQLRVPQQPLDLSASPGAAGANVAQQVPGILAQGGGTDWGAIGKAALGGAASSMAGQSEQQAPMVQAGAYRGGQTPDAATADQFSNARLDHMKAAKLGILGQSR